MSANWSQRRAELEAQMEDAGLAFNPTLGRFYQPEDPQWEDTGLDYEPADALGLFEDATLDELNKLADELQREADKQDDDAEPEDDGKGSAKPAGS